MEDQCTVQVKLELGHRAQLRKKATSEGFTHDWMVFVRGPENSDIQHFVDKVIFRLHESFPKPKRVCKEPPYKVEESGYAGFLMPIEVYFKNKEEPKKVLFNYDLFLNLEGNPPVNHLRCEKLTFNNPTRDFRKKLVRAGGIIVVPEGAELVSRPSPDYPMLPTIPLSAFSDPKKSKSSQGPKELTKDNTVISKTPKPHKLAKEHRERPRKDSESKSSSKGDAERDSSSKSSREPSSFSSSSSSKKPENKVKEESKAPPKAAFKEPKLKEPKMEGTSPKGGGPGGGGGGGGGGGTESKSSKRPSNADSPKSSIKKPKKGGGESQKSSGGGVFPGTSPRVSSSSSSSSSMAPTSGFGEKKSSKQRGSWIKGKPETPEVKEQKKPPESDESNSDDELSSKSEVRARSALQMSAPSSPSNSSSSSESSSDSDFEPQQKQGQGPLRSMVETMPSEESDEDDSSSDDETPGKNNPPNRDSRLSLDSESDSSDGPHRPSRDPPPPAPKHTSASNNNKVTGRKSPDPCLRQEKVVKKGYDKVGRAYTEELVDLHRRLMALRERNVLQQIVNLIEETGHFNVTNTTFDFDLFSLDESTVRKLQSYLEATAT
ncbi:protein ENL isoform X2 [Neoarius graeffei]|uniref:protein ENL isoform X2 n=1 Tax=Neoarius graeffei TaxID=443677 RepID=UPI00298CD535|nr:protein ENL isoform X2 [Neoarius graeffei]